MRSCQNPALLLVVTALASAQPLVNARAGMVTYIEGEAAIGTQRTSHGRYWQVMDGELLSTLQGSVEIQVSAGAVLRLSPATSLTMGRTQMDDAEANLSDGSAILEVVRLVPGSRFRLSLGQISVEARKPGVYRFDVSRRRVQVYGGELLVEGAGKRLTLKRGQQLDLDTGGAPMGFERKRNKDSFLLWSAERSFREYRASAENRVKQSHWQRIGFNRFWNETYAMEMSAPRR